MGGGKVGIYLLCVNMAKTRECGGNIDYEGCYGSPKAANVIIAFITTLLPWSAVRTNTLETLYKWKWGGNKYADYMNWHR